MNNKKANKSIAALLLLIVAFSTISAIYALLR
jgi:hypothetical protein